MSVELVDNVVQDVLEALPGASQVNSADDTHSFVPHMVEIKVAMNSIKM